MSTKKHSRSSSRADSGTHHDYRNSCTDSGSRSGNSSPSGRFGAYSKHNAKGSGNEECFDDGDAYPNTSAMPPCTHGRSRSRHEYRIVSTSDTFETQVAARRVRLIVPGRHDGVCSVPTSNPDPPRPSIRSQQYDYITNCQNNTPSLPKPAHPDSSRPSIRSQQYDYIPNIQSNMPALPKPAHPDPPRPSIRSQQYDYITNCQNITPALPKPAEPNTEICEEQRSEPVQSTGQCSGICRMEMHNVHYLHQRLKECREDIEENGEEAKIQSQMNQVYLERLCDIEYNANGDLATKLITYQEWVDMLLHINDNVTKGMDALEYEVNQQLDLSAKREYEALRDAENYRQDIRLLLKLVQNAYHHDNWDTTGLPFKTVDPATIFGNAPRRSKPKCTDPESPCLASTDEREDQQCRGRRRSVF